jgi:dTDP-4-amino-4,6-dideoxygalactose transaminase
LTDKIYMSSPDVGELEKEALLRAINSGWVAPLGPEVDAFESEIAARVGVQFGVALSSGTAALHLSLLAIGVGPGDVVITSTMTFVATANAILYTGAEPYFVDSDISTGNMNPALLRDAINTLRKENRNIGAILPVDLLGKAVDYSSISSIADEHGIPMISDAAESLGASHKGKPTGSWGIASIVSFNGNKIMTTSGGGMLLTDNPDIAEKARYLATQARQPVNHYEHTDMGFNYRLSNLLAAVGRAQLVRLDEMIEKRRNIRDLYRRLFEEVEGVSIFDGGNDLEDNCWLTSIIVDQEVTGWNSGRLNNHLGEDNIESRPLWKPMHLQPLFASLPSGQIDGSSQYLFENGLTLPSGSALTEQQIERIHTNISRFLENV